MPGVTRLRAEPVSLVAAGAVTPFGGDVDAFWSGLVTGGDAISMIERFPVDDLRVGRGGEIKKIRPLPGARRVRCRATQLLLAAAEDLLARSAISAAPERIAVVLGTALGGVEQLERAMAPDGRVRHAVDALYDSPAHALGRRLGARGPVMTVGAACAAGATALGNGADLLRADVVDVVVAGGYDALCRFVMRGFDALRSLTRERVRPFDKRRSGLLLGEAAGLVLMTREGATTGPRLGRLLGHASASDGSHVAAPDANGRGLELAIRSALDEAGLTPADVEFVSAHGTGTLVNDRIEADVLRRVLGRRAPETPVNSIKASIGHTMGAAAALEAVMCLLAGREGVVPQTLGLEEPDPACELDHVIGSPRAARPRISLSTSLGFGGCNAALVLEAVDR
jgi:3-oxoacyl-(acyl-carrier-protein) synthase